MSEHTFDSKAFLATVPTRPGCYRMYNSSDTIIYVGKAKNLKQRLSSYFQKNVNSAKTKALVSNIHHIEFTVTFSETEALILENNLIKANLPRYNILLRDDKSYPYIRLSIGAHPGIFYHRGAKTLKGEYFGPYPDSNAVKESLKLLQKIFPIRQCSDSVYAHRSRPCLMAQLGKCLAPCVSMSAEQEHFYQEQVQMVKLFLKGQNQQLLNNLTSLMEQKAKNFEYEEAAKIRDQLVALRRMQEVQSIDSQSQANFDVIGFSCAFNQACAHILFIRQGRIIGTRSYLPKIPSNTDKNEILFSFLSQYYLNYDHKGLMPNKVILDKDYECEDIKLLQEAIAKSQDLKLEFYFTKASAYLKYLNLAATNAKASLQAKLNTIISAKHKLQSLKEILKLDKINRMECFDISHTMGENTIASCVVFNQDGPDTSKYRRFNIDGITKGDDYAAMHQVLTRRYKKVTADSNPDVIFIDGGIGQLKQAQDVISEYYQHNNLKMPLLVGVAKGEGRKEGLETLIIGFSHTKYNLSLEDAALQLIIHIRNEAHRFAITGHRNKRQKAALHSFLEDIEGVGVKRRQALLKHLGGKQEVIKAGIEDLAKVPGISKELAVKIYTALHDEL